VDRESEAAAPTEEGPFVTVSHMANEFLVVNVDTNDYLLKL